MWVGGYLLNQKQLTSGYTAKENDSTLQYSFTANDSLKRDMALQHPCANDHKRCVFMSIMSSVLAIGCYHLVLEDNREYQQ